MRPGFRRAIRVLLPVLIAVAAWQIWDNAETRSVEPLLARVRAAVLSRPVVNQGSRLQPWDQANGAARLYAAAAMAANSAGASRVYFDLVASQRSALAGGVAPPADVAAKAAAFVDENLPALRLLDEANRLPFREFGAAQDFTLRLSGLLHVARAAAYRTLGFIQTGDAGAAVDSLLARVRLLRAFRYDGWGDGETEAREALSLGTDVGILLTWTDPDPARLNELAQALGGVEEQMDLGRAFAVMALSRYDFAQAAGGGRSWQYGSLGVPLRPAFNHNARLLLEVADDALAAAAKPWPERLQAVGALSDRSSWVPLPPPIPRGAWRIADRFKALTASMASAVASLRAAQAALRLDAGLPAEVAADPFTGRPLLESRHDDGYTIYSVGPNGADDGGTLAAALPKGQRPGTGRPPDVGVRVNYRRDASTSPSNSGRNSPVR